jgi:hypothetical protein
MNESQDKNQREEQLLQFIRTREPATSNILLSQQTVIKSGPQTWKTANLLHIGPRETGEIKHRTLNLEAYRWRAGLGYDFDNPEAKWYCKDDEIEKLCTFLDCFNDATAPGEHAVLKVDKNSRELVEATLEAAKHGKFTASDLRDLLSALVENPNALTFLPQLGATDYGRIVAAALRAGHQAEALKKLQQIIAAEGVEQDFQELFTKNWWMLGSRYIRLIPRREWTNEETLDLLLQSVDGYFDIIELKRSNTRLFIQDHNILIPSNEVNRAVNQAAHYISEIESSRDNLVRRYGLDLYKLKAKVLIGYLNTEDSDIKQKREALRRYNSHLHRIEVITFDQIENIAYHVLNYNISEAKSQAEE